MKKISKKQKTYFGQEPEKKKKHAKKLKLFHLN